MYNNPIYRIRIWIKAKDFCIIFLFTWAFETIPQISLQTCTRKAALGILTNCIYITWVVSAFIDIWIEKYIWSQTVPGILSSICSLSLLFDWSGNVLIKKPFFYNLRCTLVRVMTQVGPQFNPFSAGTVFIRQNMTSVDVRFWRVKTVPTLEELKYLSWSYTNNIGIQMERN